MNEDVFDTTDEDADGVGDNLVSQDSLMISFFTDNVCPY